MFLNSNVLEKFKNFYNLLSIFLNTYVGTSIFYPDKETYLPLN